MDPELERQAKADRFISEANSTLQNIKNKQERFRQSARGAASFGPADDPGGNVMIAFGVHSSNQPRPPAAPTKNRSSVSGVKGLLTQVRRAITGKSSKGESSSARRSVRDPTTSTSRRSVKLSNHAYSTSGSGASAESSAAPASASLQQDRIISPANSVSTVVVLPAPSDTQTSAAVGTAAPRDTLTASHSASSSAGHAPLLVRKRPAASGPLENVSHASAAAAAGLASATSNDGAADRTSLSYLASEVPASISQERKSAGRGLRLSAAVADSLLRTAGDDDGDQFEDDGENADDGDLQEDDDDDGEEGGGECV